MSKQATAAGAGGQLKVGTSPLQGTAPPPEARDALQRGRKSAPPGVKGIPATDEYGAKADRPPVPPVAPAGPVPRQVDGMERAPEGTQRYKIRCDAPHGPHPTRYVLAARGDEAAAVACYLEVTGVRALLDAMGVDAPEPKLVVKALPD